MAKTDLSPELERKYSHALTETLDRVDQLRADLKEETKQRKGEIAQHEKAAFRLRRLLSGKEVEQLEVPGAEVPSVKPPREKGFKVEDPKAYEFTRDGAKGTKPEPDELEWRRGQGNGVQVANVIGGQYKLASVMGRWRA